MHDGPAEWIDPFAAYWRSSGGEEDDPTDPRPVEVAALALPEIDPFDEQWSGFEDLFSADRRLRRLVEQWRRHRLEARENKS